MISDANKGITAVEYNHLNMPTKVTVTGANAGVLDYKYSADGIKLQKKKTQGGVTTTTDYAGNYVYENNVLKQFSHPEGYVEPDGSGWQYVYRLTDIWGNTRITFADDNNNGSVNSSEIRREQNYYPFGLEHKGYNNIINGTENNYKTFQEQELNEELGLNWLSFKWRNYDPAIGRFFNIDPLAEKYVDWAPYVFSGNRIIDARELEGLEPISIHSQSFIPYKTLGPFGEGGSYSGDNRNFGQVGNSRMTANVSLNLSGQGITMTGSSATGADTYDSDGNFITHSEASFERTPSLNGNNSADGTSAATDFDFHISGNNDAIAGSPDIDVKGAFGIGVVDNKDGSSTAVISGKMFGDKFPANETFMTDQAGTRIFLGVSGADGSPLTSLPGNNSRTMSTFTINVNFNTNGNATGVNYNGTNYSIADWNKRFTDLNAASNVSTNND